MILLFLLLYLAGCVHLPPPLPIEEIPLPEEPSLEISEDGGMVTIFIPNGTVIPEDTVTDFLFSLSDSIFYENYFLDITDDSLRKSLAGELKRKVKEEFLSLYSFREVRSTELAVTIILEKDLSRISQIVKEQKKPPSDRDDFSYLSGLSFLLPCPDVPIPTQANLLPNAPRSYRNGIHQGIDFPAVYGSEVRSPADGVVIRADHNYREITNEFRETLLKKAELIGFTPSDIFKHILLGRSVFIDHGVDLVDGKRLVSIHAHLSSIDELIQPGENVVRGQLLGLCGNSGTSEGALGTGRGAHLHYELSIQDEKGERYLGAGLPYPELIDLLNKIFVRE